MFIPLPVLIIGGLGIVALLLWALMRRGGQGDELSVDRHRFGQSKAPPSPPPRQSGADFAPMTAAPSIGEAFEAMSLEARAELLRLLQTRRKIEAIKLLRDETGCGLKEAKDFVDALERDGGGRL